MKSLISFGTVALLLQVGAAWGQAPNIGHGVPTAAPYTISAQVSADTTCSSDVSAAIVAATTAAQATASANGQSEAGVFFPPGCYGFTQRVNAPTTGLPVHYWAYPGTVTWRALPPTGSQTSLFMFIGAGASGHTIEGITFDGNMSAVGSDSSLFSCLNADHITFTRDAFTNARGVTMANFSGCNYSGARFSRFYNMGKWYQQAAANPTLTTTAPTTAGSNVLNFADTTGITTGTFVMDTTTANNASIPYSPPTSVTAVTPTTVTLSANVVAPGVSSGDSIKFIAYAGKGITMSSSTGNFFDDNFGDDIAGTPINMTHITNCSQSRNNFTASANSWSNIFSGGGTGGIYAFDDGTAGGQPTGCKFVDNQIYGFTGNGMDLNGLLGAVVTGNIAKGSGGAGVSLSVAQGNPAMNGVAVAGNTINDNGQVTSGLVTLTSAAGTSSKGTTTIAFASTAGLSTGMYARDVAFTCVIPGSKIASLVPNTSITLDTPLGADCTGAQAYNFSPKYARQYSNNSGLSLTCTPASASCSFTNVAVIGNTLADDQATPTQQYGIQFSNLATLTNVNIDASSNKASGNAVASMSSYPTALSFSLTFPDGTVAGGNALGSQAVDLQYQRGAANQVASGANSFAAGRNNNVSGQGAAAFGNANNCSGVNTLCLGASTSAVPNAMIAHASGRFATNGDAQNFRWHGMATSGGLAGTYQLTAGGAAAAPGSILSLLNNVAADITCNMTVHDATPSTGMSTFTIHTALVRGPSPASTALPTGATTAWTAGASSGSAVGVVSAPAIAADTANGGLKVQFTVTGTIVWHASADCFGTWTN
jgi:hypothetical protein